jgi:amidase
MRQAYQGRYYAKAQNLSRALAGAYDQALNQWDVLAMPTLGVKAAEIPLPAIYAGPGNTFPFDVTGHPALNVPCAMSSGLPVGMMLVGRMGEDAVLLRTADAFARKVFTAPPPPAAK